MPRQCHFCHGRSDDYDEANLKRCSGCQKVYYCSTSCQKYDWVSHIFDCKPRRPINTADYLALAVRQNLLPQHPQTCDDYGFSRAFDPQDKSKLLGLYIGLIEVMEISPKTIHNWRVRGVLIDEIKLAYYKIPETSRGGYFPWFLQNEHLLTGGPPSEAQMRSEGDAMILRAWQYTGGNPKDSAESVRAAISCLDAEEQKCHALYALLLTKWHPCPSLPIWIDFGFCACEGEEEEMWLGGRYQELISECTFKEFCNAFRSSTLLDLFGAKEIIMDLISSSVQDVLRGPHKSVWCLKQVALQDDPNFQVPNPVWFDYGFMNCKNDSEKRQLRRVYKAFFASPGADPLALHEAAIKGKIHGYVSNIVKGTKNPKFERLMKNMYPLHGV
ncbi:hypothetical protein F5I97DRAFT_642652 [Phlebopus sp. FC_14]|nr:hypothetical protein F5I97DRAFT_642652 [Phlebopus sp. FC_14]